MIASGHIASNSLRAAVQADHSSGNAILVSADHASSLSLLISADHITAYDVGVFTAIAADHVAIYSIRQAVLNNHVSVFDIIYIPVAEHTAVYSIRQGVSADHIFRNAIRIKTKTAHTSINTFLVSGDHGGINRIGFLSRDVRFIWSLNPAIACNFTSLNTIFQQSIAQNFIHLNSGLISQDTVHLYSIKSEARLDFVSVNFLASAAAADYGIKFDLLTRTPVAADFVFPNVLTLSTSKIQNSVSALIGSQSISLLSIDIESSENFYCINMVAEVADMANWILCEPGQEIEIEINSVSYRFVLDARERFVEFGSSRLSISGRSKTALLGEGYAEPITKNWPATTALAVADELCMSAGITCIYLISDWNIPAELLTAESLFPIQILKKIADAAGAILQSTPSGELLIQPLYPVEPPLYGAASPDVVLSGPENIFSLLETRESRPGWNAVLVMDMPDATAQYFIERVSEENGVIILVVYIYPFVDEISFQSSYQSPSLSIWEEGLIIDELEEEIEIIHGAGSTTKPVLSIIDTDYGNSIDLGSVSADGPVIATATKGQSLLRLRYQTQYFKFRVKNTDPEKVQFYFEEAA